MSRTHDAIRTFATNFATSALGRMCPSVTTSSLALSYTEHFRFCRAFYRVELFYTLFGDGAFEDSDFEVITRPSFFSRLAPWENEQLASVYEYLDTTFAQSQSSPVPSGEQEQERRLGGGMV